MLKNRLLVLTLVTLLIISFSFVSVKAFAITAPYWSTSPMILDPGQSKTIGFGLQNMVGEEDITLIGEITQGSDMAEIVDEFNEYFVPFGSKDEVIVHVKVTMPEDAQIGEEYTIALTLTTVTPGEKGGVALGASIVKEVPVIAGSVIPTTTEGALEWNTTTISSLVVAIIVILIIIWIILRKRKKSKTKEGKKK